MVFRFLSLAIGEAAIEKTLSAVGGTLVVFIPSNSGLVIAADKRRSPRGVFCDGVRKILIPKRPQHTAVVVTGFVTMQEIPDDIPDSKLCAYLAETPAPVDFGRIALDFLESQNSPINRLDGQALTDQIFHDIAPFLSAGNLREVHGTRVAQIIFAGFDPSVMKSTILAFGIDIDQAGAFRLQPLPVTSATTIHGTAFDPKSSPAVLPFGEVPYFNQHVLSAAGQHLLSDDYPRLLQKKSVSDVDLDLAVSVALNLIDAASQTTEIIPAPSGIGGGSSLVILGENTKIVD
jgi:hypothetical protein